MTLYDTIFAAYQFIGEYRERVIRGQIDGNLLKGDYEIWKSLQNLCGQTPDEAEPEPEREHICPACAFPLATVRGANPTDKNRTVCPQCNRETLDYIHLTSGVGFSRSISGTAAQTGK